MPIPLLRPLELQTGYYATSLADTATQIGLQLPVAALAVLAFASYYPASYLLGRAAGGLLWLGPLVAAVLLAAGYGLWLFGLRHYSGTGS